MTIWKYKLYVNSDVQKIEVQGAEESKVVAARVSDFHDIIDLWIEVHPAEDVGVLEFRVVGTGHRIGVTPDRQTVHGFTVFDPTFDLVWHIYQLHEVPV